MSHDQGIRTALQVYYIGKDEDLQRESQQVTDPVEEIFEKSKSGSVITELMGIWKSCMVNIS